MVVTDFNPPRDALDGIETCPTAHGRTVEQEYYKRLCEALTSTPDAAWCKSGEGTSDSVRPNYGTLGGL